MFFDCDLLSEVDRQKFHAGKDLSLRVPQGAESNDKWNREKEMRPVSQDLINGSEGLPSRTTRERILSPGRTFQTRG